MVCLFNQYLVGGCTNPFEKYAQVNSDHETPRFRVNITNIWSHLEIWLRIYRFQSLHSTQQMMIGNHGSEPNGRAKVLLNAWLPPMYGRLRQSWFHCEAAVGPQLEVCWPRFTSNHHFSGAILVSEVVDPDPSSFTLFQIYETNSSPKMKIEPVGRYHSFFNLGWHLGPFSGPKWQFQGGYHNEWEKKWELIQLIPLQNPFSPGCKSYFSSWWFQPPFEKYDRQNWFIFPNFRGENSKKYLSCHHLVIISWFIGLMIYWVYPLLYDLINPINLNSPVFICPPTQNKTTTWVPFLVEFASFEEPFNLSFKIDWLTHRIWWTARRGTKSEFHVQLIV